MAVNLNPPVASELHPVSGVKLGIAKAAVKYQNRKDLLVVTLTDQTTVSGVFTQNRFCAAPVQICKEHLEKVKKDARPIKALIVNTGNANAGTGEPGYKNAKLTCTELAKLVGCQEDQILPFSTGVILEPLPIDRVIAGIPEALSDLKEANWYDAAEAIMTTDTVPKAVSKIYQIGGQSITITGICKGAGMIRPNMATMLGFMATDAKVPQVVIDAILKEAVNASFNCITVDGDTSTNDSYILMASGEKDIGVISTSSPNYTALKNAIIELSQELSQKIVRDGEGASKFITIIVENGKTVEECRTIAYSIAHSPLVKTAFFASDPNLGRILAAIGYADVPDLDVTRLNLYLDDVWVAKNGERNPGYQEADGQRVMKKNEILVRVDLARGSTSATVWTCDLSHDYVSINADYRS